MNPESIKIKYIDIHSHLSFADYGNDLKDVIKRMKEADVGTITIGTDLESSKEAVQIAEENKNFIIIAIFQILNSIQF